jgi:malto-oligosyltrehalose synthase
MRLQLHKDFTFQDATDVVPYLAALGVSHMYASPILTARAGSMHGYDVIDATRVNPELGGEAGLRDLVAALRTAGLGLIVDIVPNHMAVGHDNAWWYDVMRHGRHSQYASYFDIDWDVDDPDLCGRVLAPFLGKPYGEVLADGELRLDQWNNEPVIRYFDAIFPIAPETRSHIQTDSLHELLERQHYRLAWWGTAGDQVNWRRFFDINGLIGIRVELPEVFEATHETLFRLYAEGLIDGVRVDHVDGLADPPGYCRRLRARLRDLESLRPHGAPSGLAYFVVEKILGTGEQMPVGWEVDGTSGYDFMDVVNAVQHDPAAEPALAALWAGISERPASFTTEETEARREILTTNFAGQLQAAAAALDAIARLQPETRDTTEAAIRRGLIALLAHFPVYRTYDAGALRSPADDTAFQTALAAAKADSPLALHPVLDRLDAWLGGVVPPEDALALYKLAGTRFQQLSAPVAAKAVEDTAFYRYGRLLSRNDVGFDAALLGNGPQPFHDNCQARAARFPAAMLATATHDHKRGEDLRARLAVLSEIPDAWESAITVWRDINQRHRCSQEASSPSPGDEAMLYQMIIGAWPPDLDAADDEGCEAFAGRLAAWQEKALREAKLRTDWTSPNEAYESASSHFLFDILGPGSAFRAEAAAFARRVGPAGAVNGLAQTLLKLTTPGVPDFFQGTDLWDFSLVDPDNRRPVDFAERILAMREAGDPVELASHWRDGRVKQALIARALHARGDSPALFQAGDYVPVAAIGPLADHVIAFTRSHDNRHCLVVVPRLTVRLLTGDDSMVFAADAWDGTSIELPESLVNAQWRDPFTGRVCTSDGALMAVSDLLGCFPVAMLTTPV